MKNRSGEKKPQFLIKVFQLDQLSKSVSLGTPHYSAGPMYSTSVSSQEQVVGTKYVLGSS